MDDIRFPPLEVWTPDVELYNAREKKLVASQLTDRLVLKRTGSITWVPPYLLTAACTLDTTWFPFDEQECTLKFGSWTYNGFKLDLHLVSLTPSQTSSARIVTEFGQCGHFLLRH